MFRQGKRRTFIHDLRLASILSFVAGVVNISGLLSIQTLTTNVTGHFAFFSEQFVTSNYYQAWNFVSYIISFLLGAFICGFIVERLSQKNHQTSHGIPMLLEIAALLFIAFAYDNIGAVWIARVLLFSMGLQNALVTKISRAVVRTTHLTGLFTDLGIELSQLLLHRNEPDAQKLKKSIYLRLAIISFFFIGCVIGGFLYKHLFIKTVLVAASALFVALVYDNILLWFRWRPK